MQPQNIVRLKIKNFMGISNVEIKPNQINPIIGKNNQSKTTILKAIEATFKGSTNGGLVKHGEDQAELFIELPDQTTIRRILKPNGTQALTVRDKNDFKIPSPQTYLEQLVDYSGFNPLDCLEPKERHEAILKAIDLKVTPEMIANRIEVKIEEIPKFNFDQHGLKVIDEAYNYYDKRRTEANRDALTKHNKWKSYDADFKPVAPPEHDRSTIKIEREKVTLRRTEATVQIRSIESVETDNVATNTKLSRYKTGMETVKAEKEQTAKLNFDKITALNDQIAALKKQIEEISANDFTSHSVFNQRLEDGTKLISETEKEIKAVPDKTSFVAELADCDVLTEILNGADKELDAFDAVQQQGKMIKDLETDWKSSQEYADAIERQAKLLQHQYKKELMATIEMPIAGLEYVDGTFLVNGVQVDSLSSSLAMTLALNIAKKLSKKSKIILLDGVERLDSETREAIFAQIKDDGFIYFLTFVGDSGLNVPEITMNKGMVQ